MSREYRGKRVVIYPQYIDSLKTRSSGRKVSLKHAVPNPKIDEIVRAAEKLGLEPTVESGKYSREWWTSSQRVVVLKKSSKSKILRDIASSVRELRGPRR